MKVWCVFQIVEGGHYLLTKIFDSEEKAEKWIAVKGEPDLYSVTDWHVK